MRRRGGVKVRRKEGMNQEWPMYVYVGRAYGPT